MCPSDPDPTVSMQQSSSVVSGFPRGPESESIIWRWYKNGITGRAGIPTAVVVFKVLCDSCEPCADICRKALFLEDFKS